MSDEINLILPGDIPNEVAKAAAAGGDPNLSPEALLEAERQAEGREIEGLVLAISNTDIAPYKADAPICAFQGDSTAIPTPTKHWKVVNVPAWMHGRCIGAACGRFKVTKKGPICGAELEALAAGKSLKVITAAEVDAEFARWAYPAPEEAPDA